MKVKHQLFNVWETRCGYGDMKYHRLEHMTVKSHITQLGSPGCQHAWVWPYLFKKKKKKPNSHVLLQHTEKWKQHNSTWENLATTTTLSWPLASERVPWMVAASFTVHTISPLLFPFCKISLPESILFRHCTFISVGHFCLSTAWFHNCRVGAAWVMWR